MDDIRVVNFQRDNPGISFPWVQGVDASRCEAIRRALAQSMNLGVHVPGLELVRTIREKAKLIDGADAESEFFNVAELPVIWHDSVYLNWGRFDSLDEMKAEDVKQWFDYLWYPSADDLDILDSDLEWVISIAHSGEVYVLFSNLELQNERG